MASCVWLTKVPREIWEIILLHLPSYDDLVVASLTCHLWRDILADHLVCPAMCSVVTHGWKVDQPFVYNFLPGTPPSEKDEKLPLGCAVSRWVTWPHVPLCFEVVLQDRRERGPQRKSKAHYGLNVQWVFRGLIPYTEKERRMDNDSQQRTTFTHQTLPFTGGGRDGVVPHAKEADGHLEPMLVVATTTTAGEDDEHDTTNAFIGEREPKRARSREAGLTESQEMERRAQQNDDIIQQARQMLGLGAAGGTGTPSRHTHSHQQPPSPQRSVDMERHIVAVDGPQDKHQGQFAFYSKQLFMMRGERLKEVVSSLVDEVRRERRNDENVPMVGLIVERVKDEDAIVSCGQGGSSSGSGGASYGSGSTRWRGETTEATVMMREGEWRCVGGRGSDRRDNNNNNNDEGDDQDNTPSITTPPSSASAAPPSQASTSAVGGGCKARSEQTAATVAATSKENGKKSYMAGFYIPHMDKYAFGTDTLVFELHVKIGGAHIPASPFLLAFFNPLLP